MCDRLQRRIRIARKEAEKKKKRKQHLESLGWVATDCRVHIQKEIENCKRYLPIQAAFRSVK